MSGSQRNPQRSGFTLIELMIVVSIIGILSAIAIPRFAKLIAKSRESTTKGNLGAIRGALAIYYSETEGVYPMDDLSGSLLIEQKYLPAIPPALFPVTDNSAGHEGSFNDVLTGIIPDASDDVATPNGWLYDNTANGSATWGRIIANCTHSDNQGNIWTSI
jgi:prepilin-type N-terminal cleavage/methylation domain-containing protein